MVTFRWLSLLGLASAFAALVALLVSDGVHGFRPIDFHQNASAVALMSVGLSYVFLQIVSEEGGRAKLKGVLLGSAFFLWGIEQFIPRGVCATLTDCIVITIFVVDLGSIVIARLRQRWS